MRIHHLSCGTMCPLGGHLMDGVTPGFGPATLVCHCLLIETEQGLVLVDTGLGLGDASMPHQRLDPFYVKLLRLQLDPERTAARQVERLGFRTVDVRHIVLTHLDFDHAGGLEDFPHARVHVFEDELRAANWRDGYVGRARYRPRQWDGVPWHTYGPHGEPWFGFPAVRALDGLPPEVLMVPLIGHTRGHCGVAVDTANGWLLNAGDAYFHHTEMDASHPRCPAGLRAYQRLMEVDRTARLANQERLRELLRSHGGDVTVFCGHDRTEFERLSTPVQPPANEPGTPDTAASARAS